MAVLPKIKHTATFSTLPVPESRLNLSLHELLDHSFNGRTEKAWKARPTHQRDDFFFSLSPKSIIQRCCFVATMAASEQPMTSVTTWCCGGAPGLCLEIVSCYHQSLSECMPGMLSALLWSAKTPPAWPAATYPLSTRCEVKWHGFEGKTGAFHVAPDER